MSRLTKLLRRKTLAKEEGPISESREAFEHSLFPNPNPSVGVVIGTYGSPAYIELQLEAHRRFWPDVPTLVHDDASPDADRLRALCDAAGVEFMSDSKRRGWLLGDIAAVIDGLDWARERRLDTLVKVSRRYLIYHNWVPGFKLLCYSSPYVTYSNFCAHFNLPIRSECLGFHVERWHASGVPQEMRGYVERGRREHANAETCYHGYVHLAQSRQDSPALRFQQERFRRDPRWEDYALWPILGSSRVFRVPGVLWHDAHPAEAYYELAQSWGLTHLAREEFGMESFLEAKQTEMRVLSEAAQDTTR